MVKFSIIIPTYNRILKLKKSLDSVKKQTYQEFEIVIVDDGSTDGTREYIYGLNDNNIKYVWQENSGLPSIARNKGIEIASNEWICFLDSDDFWEDEKLDYIKTEILRKNKKNIIAIVHWEYLIVNGVRKGVLKNGLIDSGNQYEDLLFKGNVYSTSAMTFRKDVLITSGGFDISERYYIVEDYELWLRLSKQGYIKSVKKILGNYCLDESGNISSDINKLNDNLINVVVDNINLLTLSNTAKKKLIRRHKSRINYYRGRSFQMRGEFKMAIPILFDSIKESPDAIKKYISIIFAFLFIRL